MIFMRAQHAYEMATVRLRARTRHRSHERKIRTLIRSRSEDCSRDSLDATAAVSAHERSMSIRAEGHDTTARAQYQVS
jgi:hypothetical protein